MDEELYGKKCDFGQFGAFLGGFGPFLGPWGRNESFPKMFYSAQLDMKIELVAKFEKKTDGQLSHISLDRLMNGRTGLITRTRSQILVSFLCHFYIFGKA